MKPKSKDPFDKLLIESMMSLYSGDSFNDELRRVVFEYLYFIDFESLFKII